MSEEARDPAAEKRRELWRELPSPIEPEDTTTSEDVSEPQPDLVPDPEHEFMIRHAG